MQDKTILITFGSGETVKISHLAIAGLRAAHYAAKDMINADSDYMEAFRLEVEHGMNDSLDTIDFMVGNMNWAEIIVYNRDEQSFVYLLDLESKWKSQDHSITFITPPKEEAMSSDEDMFSNKKEEIEMPREEYHYIKIVKVYGEGTKVHFLGTDKTESFGSSIDLAIAHYGKLGYRTAHMNIGIESIVVYMEKMLLFYEYD